MNKGYPHWVYCKGCGARIQGKVIGEIEGVKASVEAWNRRAEDHIREVAKKIEPEQCAKEEERVCQLCNCYDKQSCYCNLHGIWTESDFYCKAWEPEGVEDDDNENG